MIKPVLHEIILNDKAWEPLGHFVGRQNELNRLEWILKSGQGSVTLIAGNRGSGKTTLIFTAIEEAEKIKTSLRRSSWRYLGRLMWWARKYSISVSIPLLPTDIPNEEIRDTTLRLIVKAVVSNWRTKSILQKGLLPLRYGQAIKKIDKLLRYKRIIHTTRLGIEHSKMSAQRGSEYEVDLSYADLELELSAFLKKFSKWIDFTIIFDELDKYEGRSTSLLPVKPHDYIRELKNLFTLSSAKFIFTSSEDYYHEVDETASENALRLHDYKFSLFTHKILIDRLDPEDFSTYFNSLATNVNEAKLLPIQIEPYQKLKYAVMWLSELYPFSAKRILANLSNTQQGGVGIIDLSSVDNEIGTFGNDIAGLQYVINRSYLDHKTRNDSYFNHILYRSLQRVVQTLYTGREIKVNKSNLYGLIFSDFVGEYKDEYQVFMETEFYSTGYGPDLSDKAPFWVKKIENLRPPQRQALNDAVIELVLTLDGLFLLNIVQDETSISFIHISYQSYNYTIEELDEIIGSLEGTIRKARSRRDSLSRQIIKSINNTKVNSKIPVLLSTNHGDLTASGVPFNRGWELPSLIDHEIRVLSGVRSIIYEDATNQLKDTVATKYKKYLTRPGVYKFGKYRYAILFRATAEEINDTLADSIVQKIICINSIEKINNKARIKYFSLQARTLSDYPKLLRNLDKYVQQKVKDTK